MIGQVIQGQVSLATDLSSYQRVILRTFTKSAKLEVKVEINNSSFKRKKKNFTYFYFDNINKENVDGVGK